MVDLEEYGINMWPEEKIIAFRKTLLQWYDENKRDLPWRKNTLPYSVWVSEIMLQQTRVDTVIPYYRRFLEWFPTITDLAEAPEQTLLKAWEGLGYYSRARNMQAAAKQMVELYNGEFPTTYEEIIQLKGIGPYTAGAISSISFNLPTPAVDGNLMRVISRLFEIPYDIGQPSNRKIYQAVAEILIDPDRPGDFNQALMDLGSDIESAFTPKPELNPIKEFSSAYLNGTMDQYPVKKPKKKPRPIKYKAFVIQNKQGEYLLEKNNQADLLSGFWHFPLIEDFTKEAKQIDLLENEMQEEYQVPNQDIPLEIQFETLYHCKVSWQESTYKQVQHIFSHQKWFITIQSGLTNDDIVSDDHKRELKWVSSEEFSTYPFAKPQQKIWHEIQKAHKFL
ncbi:A/G-specific DNA-adenine glycosylase [Granulicatella balaenopterae]|uniref:Adenine DNA glycosylase n=1 Tax=Granulicatella balaenopterae TaxID=137733 RepID=A0A1H9H866_9LACT|nr:A/G-specific adenine glycosylase [Granulicatella balaenopterae]SEQ58512.1 A/G-specific DNA-adenine glycosylase [Granulicatella balaenopterae]